MGPVPDRLVSVRPRDKLPFGNRPHLGRYKTCCCFPKAVVREATNFRKVFTQAARPLQASVCLKQVSGLYCSTGAGGGVNPVLR